MPHLVSYTFSLCLVLLLSSCSGNSTDGDGASGVSAEITGTHRVISVTQTYADGTVDLFSYSYSDAGRLVAIDVMRNGNPAARLSYTYTPDGLLDQRSFDNDLDGVGDFVRQYVYENGRFAGWYGSESGALPDSVEQYFYTADQISGYERRTLDVPTATPDLSEGSAIFRATLSYNEAGFVIANTIDNEPFDSVDEQVDFQLDEFGRRTMSSINSTSEGTTSSSVFEYMESPCIAFPAGTWTQHICVQVDD